MKLQRQHFLLSYLKTLSVGPVGVSNSRPPASQPGAQPSEPPVRGARCAVRGLIYILKATRGIKNKIEANGFYFTVDVVFCLLGLADQVTVTKDEVQKTDRQFEHSK